MNDNIILLVEDDPNDVILIQRAFQLTNINHSLQVVDNGEEAIYYVKGKGKYKDREKYPLPEIILLDLKLPRVSGLEVLRWLREESSVKRLPVIILTSSIENKDLNRAYDLGVNSYLIKPVGFEYLQALIKNFVNYWLLINKNPGRINEEEK